MKKGMAIGLVGIGLLAGSGSAGADPSILNENTKIKQICLNMLRADGEEELVVDGDGGPLTAAMMQRNIAALRRLNPGLKLTDDVAYMVFFRDCALVFMRLYADTLTPSTPPAAVSPKLPDYQQRIRELRK